MGKEKPETKDRFGENVQNGISDDLGIETDIARAISNTPDAIMNQRPFIKTNERGTYMG